jgi:hypothetical protein
MDTPEEQLVREEQAKATVAAVHDATKATLEHFKEGGGRAAVAAQATLQRKRVEANRNIQGPAPIFMPSLAAKQRAAAGGNRAEQAGATAADRLQANGRYTHPAKKKAAMALIKAHNQQVSGSRVQHDGDRPLRPCSVQRTRHPLSTPP